MSDPDLTDDVIWANHTSVGEDQALMRHFPARHGYILTWTSECGLALLPVANLASDAVPDARPDRRD
jgi:hypothetical protein